MSYIPTSFQDRRGRDRRLWKIVWLLALIINLGLFGAFMLCDSLRYSLFTAEEQVELSEEELRARKEMLRERLRREREKFQLSEEDAEKLKEESIEAQIASIHEYVRSLIAMKERAEAIKKQGLARVGKRTIEEYRDRRLESIEFGVNHLLDNMRGYALDPDWAPFFVQQKVKMAGLVSDLHKEAEQLQVSAEQLAADNANEQHIEKFQISLRKACSFMRNARRYSGLRQEMDSKVRVWSEKDLHLLEGRLKDYRLNLDMDMDAFNDVSVALERFLNAPVTDDFEKRSIGNIYRLAVALEKYCKDAMKDARACNLCIIDNISFNDALAKLASMESERPDLADALDDAAQNMADLAEWQKLLAQARAEMMDMANAVEVAASQSALTTALGGLIPIGSTGGGMGNMFSNFSSSSPSDMMFMPNMDIVGVMRQASNASGLGALDDKKSGGGGKEMQQLFRSMEEMKLNEALVRKNAAPGRIFSKDAKTKGFLYVDTWYAIGPWENDGQVDYGRRHPPEWEINFDRAYLDGKEDESGAARKLEWRFIQSSTIRVTVPDEVDDGTYYLYTELFFEDDMEMFMVIASDDAASVRVTNPLGNQLEIWRDSAKSSWSMDEGAKKVFFSEGYHKVLVRLENGPTYASFSMLLFPAEQTGSGS